VKILGLFNGILEFINKFKNQNNKEKENADFTKFSEFLYDASDDTEYQIVKHSIILCNKGLIACRQRI